MPGKKNWVDYLDEDPNDGATRGKGNGDWTDYDTFDVASSVGNNIVNRMNTYLGNHNSYITDYQNRYSSRKGNYEDAYVSDSAKWMETVQSRNGALDTEANDILSYMDQYKSYLSEDWMKQVREAITSTRDVHKSIYDVADKDNQYWSSFGTEELLKDHGSAEEAYKYGQRVDGYGKKYDGKTFSELQGIIDTMEDGEEKEWLTSYAASVDYDEKAVADLDPIRKKITRLEERIRTIQNLGRYTYEGDAEFGEYASDLEETEAELEQAKEYLASAERIQTGIEHYYGPSDQASEYYDPEFKDLSVYKSTENDEWYAGLFVPAWDSVDYETINGNENARDTQIIAGANSKIARKEAERILKFKNYLTDEEKAIYNYQFSKYGEDKANEFLDWIEETVNYRKAAERFKQLEGKTFQEFLFGIEAGLDQFESGIVNLFSNKDYITPTSTQILSGMVREDLADDSFHIWYNFKTGKWEDEVFGSSVGQGVYDLTTTSANMAPSILTSAVVSYFNPAAGSWVGSALMGGSAAGNAYADAINRGFDKGQARVYSTAIGVSEALLQKFIGGIGKLGGTSAKITKAVSGIDNALLRFSLRYGGSFASEALEEGLQEILDPIFQNAILGADESVNWEEVVYSALLGGLSGGLFEGGGIVADVHTEQTFKKQYGGYTDALVKEGLESDANSESYRLAAEYKAKTDAKKPLTGAEIRNLVEANERQFAVEDFETAKTEAGKRLTELGQTGNVSQIAELAAKRALGQDLTRSEISILANSQYGAQVAKEMQQATQPDTVTRSFDKNQTAAYKPLEDRVVEEAPARVSSTGKAVIRGTDEEIDLTNIKVKAISEDGVVLDVNGRDVDISEIDFANEDQWNMFNALKKIEHITPGVATDMIAKVDMSKPVWGQLNGLDEAFTYGYYGYSEADLKAGNFTGNLTKVQLNDAYKLGQYVAKNDVADKTATIKMRTAEDVKHTKKQKAERLKARFESEDVEVYFKDGEKTVKFEDSGKYDEKRMAAVNYAKFLSKLGIGGKYYFYKSYVNKDDQRVYRNAKGEEVDAPNGIFYESDGSIHIDLNAGNNGEGTALFTLSHELTHFIKKWSPEKFKVLADFLVKEYGSTDTSMHKRVLRKQKFLESKRGESVSYEEAFEEVVADAMSTMLSDGDLHLKLAKLRSQDKGLFNKIKQFFNRLIAKFRNEYAQLTPVQQDARDVRAMKDAFDRIQTAFAEALVEASDNFQAAMENVVETNSKPMPAEQIVTDGAVVTDGKGERHSIRSMKHDIADGKMFEDLKNVCGWTQAQVDALKTQLTDLVEYMTPYRNILDMNESYGAEGRRFSPYKPNSDPLYKISMDFSTLCSKRLLTQYVIEQLQLRENRPMSAEEQMAIRDMLNEYRKVEKGLQVACAMCYVEAARLKAPKQIQRWLSDPTPHLRNYFAQKNTEFNDAVKEAQADFKESKGYDRNAPKKDMKPADVKELNKIGPKLRSKYQFSAEEQAIVEKAKTLPNSTYLTAGNLADLSESDPVIYTAYTAFVRTATRSKSLESDEPYYYGDSTRDNGNGIVVTDSFIDAVNKENGMRFSSWSDWRIQHLLDYITAVIDNSVRGAAMHGYTKFGDEVRVLGKTGMMFNMSGVTGTQTGLNEDGSLNFSETESIDVNEAKQLRDEFPETAGLQCIGVSDAHIIAMLKSDIIDYVIPYHVSGLNADLRRMAKIHGWDDYTGTQNAPIDKGIKFDEAVDKEHWHQEPAFSEFFVGYDTGMTGIEAMRASAEKYKQMCKDRGLTPKFDQFANEENYWKLLIDRKMINQKTGNLIRQKAVTPTFDFDVIKGVVDGFVQNYDAGLEKRALNHIVENWDSIPQRIKDLKKAGTAKKAVNNLANQTLAAQPKDGKKFSVREAFFKEYDAWDKKDTNKAFVVGTTSDALKSVGMKDQNIVLRSGTVLQKVKKHSEISFDTFKGVPELLEHPVIVQFSDAIDPITKKPKYDSRITVLGELYANGKPVLVSLELMPTNQKKTVVLDFAVVTSAYTKDTIQQYLNENSILYIDPDKKRTDSWLSLNRLQLPLGEKSYGPIRRIAYVDGKVKVQNSKNMTAVEKALFDAGVIDEFGQKRNSDRGPITDSDGNQLTREQQEFFKDSKARDKNGNLLRLYHGSNYKVTKFDPAFSDDKTSLFMTDKFDVAASYTSRNRELNPYEYIDEKTPVEELVSAANKYVSGKHNIQAVSDSDIKAATDLVIPKLPSVIERLNAISDKLNNSRLANTFGAKGLSNNMETARSILGSNPVESKYEKLLSQTIGNNPWLSQVADNISSLAAFDGFDFVREDIDWVVSDINNIRYEAELLHAKALSGRGLTFRYEDNFGKTAFTSEAKIRREINWATSGGILPVYANITNPYVVDAKGRRWNNIATPETMRSFHDFDTTNTRTVAAFAKANGYDGVIFNGLVDMGGNSAQKSQRSTVVIAFDGSQMKSTMNQNPTSDPDIRYSDRAQDQAYMEAVNSNDMDTAQKMVDEAAERAGYPVKAYHGTSSFGFTKFDPKMSDDKTTLFFTDNIKIASTYAGRDTRGVKRLADAKSFKYERGKIYTEAELKEAYDVIQSNWFVYGDIKINAENQTVSHAGKRYSAKQVMDMADRISKEGIYGVYLHTENALEVDAGYTGWSNIKNPEAVEWKYKINYQGDGDFNYFKGKAEDMFRFELQKDGESVYSGTISFAEMKAMLHKAIGSDRSEMAIRHATDGSGIGTYRFDTAYSDANGNYIKPVLNTRELAQYAKKNGYSGVVVKNLYDFGGKNTPVTAKFAMEKAGSATIYILFNANQVKSADPVTYDDQGKVVPLSERFKNSNDDIRFSERGDGVSNRTLLANAFEGITQNSEEYKLIQQYKGRIKLLNEYEEKLSKLNAEIREIRFGKGKYDAERLAQLEAKAKEMAKLISKNDKKLLSLEASEPLRKVIEQERRKEAQKTKEHVQEIQQNKKLRAEQAEYRHKIRKVIRDLDKLLNRGNKKTNVKEDMRGFVSKALDLADYLFTDHVSNDDLIRRGITVRMTTKEEALVKETEGILAQLYDNADSLTDEQFTKLDAQRKRNLEKLRDLLTAQRNERLNIPVYNLFNDLVTEYASLKNSTQEAVKAAYNPEVEGFLRSYLGETDGETDSGRKTLLQNMRVADMTTDELWRLYNAYKMVLTTVRDANKLHIQGKAESIQQVVDAITLDFTKRKAPEGKVATVIRNLSNKIGWDYEKLHYALDRIGSEAFTELVMNIANSENIVMQDVIEAALFRDEMVKKYGFNNWDVNKKLGKELLDTTGKKFDLTLGQLMALYAYSRRDGAWDHIEYGGFVFGEKALTDPRPADSYKLTKDQCEAITNLLTKEQKAYVEDMQKFLSETMGVKGNEVSMQLYGIKMFGEKNYFPIHIAGQYKANAQESQAKAASGFTSMTNAGFTHAQNPNAKAPFVLEGFNEIWADHVNEMSRYHGTVPALEDLRRVMNRSTYSDSTADSMSIQALMENSFGKDAVEYFTNLYREANSGAIRDKLEQKSHKLLSLFRKGAVAYSLSVIVQQPTSIIRAYSMIDKKYFGFKGFGTITSGIVKAVADKWTKAHTNAYNEMLKYAPGVTMAKEIGGFDTHTGGSIRTYLLDTDKTLIQSMKTENAKGKAKAIIGLVDDNAVANLPNLADKIAWIEIWNACKRETVAKHKDLATSSEEFMKIVGDRFTEVIRATQVYDSIFAKSPMLRSKSLAVQYLVSFMNEPNTTANMAESAVRDAMRGDWKSGARKATSLIHATIMVAVAKSLIYGMRDDDEDETYTEKFLEAFAGSLVDDFNPVNYIPIAKDVWSVAQGYDVERSDMAVVSDAISALNDVIENATKDTDDMSEAELIEYDKQVTDANWKLVEALATCFGIPVKNIRREIKGAIDHARIASANAGKTTKQSALDKIQDAVIDSIPFMKNDRTKTDRIYDAIVNGDKTYLDRLKSTYSTDTAYQNAVRKALRENDPRIHEAARARYEGNTEEYKRLFREVQKEGNFTFDDIMSAINSEVSKIRSGVEPDNATSAYSVGGFVEAVILGDKSGASTMKQDIIATHIANGKTKDEAEKQFMSDVSSSVRDAYSSGLLNEAGAKRMLQEYAGKDEEESASKVNYWAFCEKNPKYKDVFTETHLQDYNEFAKPAGISVDMYAKYINGTKGLATKYDKWGDVEVTKREQVLGFIDSLPLSWEQKDALYLAAGYSESKIWDVPW